MPGFPSARGRKVFTTSRSGTQHETRRQPLAVTSRPVTDPEHWPHDVMSISRSTPSHVQRTAVRQRCASATWNSIVRPELSRLAASGWADERLVNVRRQAGRPVVPVMGERLSCTRIFLARGGSETITEHHPYRCSHNRSARQLPPVAVPLRCMAMTARDTKSVARPVDDTHAKVYGRRRSPVDGTSSCILRSSGSRGPQIVPRCPRGAKSCVDLSVARPRTRASTQRVQDCRVRLDG